MPWYSQVHGQFAYFAHQLGNRDWRGLTVLDFGGNVGNLLDDPAATIEHGKYWCLDVEREPLERGRTKYPLANWIFYDRYSFRYNPGGVRGLPVPELGPRFDYILAYSVFTNTSRSDMIDLVADLRRQLAPSGRLAFTYMDPHYCVPRADGRRVSALEMRLENPFGGTEGLDVQGMMARARGADWCVLINDTELYVNGEGAPEVGGEVQDSHLTFYTGRYLESLFPDIVLRPAPGIEVHQCAILGPPPASRPDAERTP